MSKRMSRREMRQAGLLKPKPADDREVEPTDSAPDAEQSPDAQSATSAGTALDEGGQDPEATPGTDFDEAAPEAGIPNDVHESRAVEGDDADDTSGFDSLTDDATQQHDTLGSYEKTDEQENAEIPERTSVFDRFSAVEKDKNAEADGNLGEQAPHVSSAESADFANGDTGADDRGTDQEAADEVAATGAFTGASTDASRDDSDQTEVHDRAELDSAEANAASEMSDSEHDGESNHNDDEDFAGALRAKLKSQPPIQESERERAEEVEYEDAPTSKWKTILLFLVLIVVGFGVGILLGSLLFSGGGSTASALLSTYYHGAL